MSSVDKGPRNNWLLAFLILALPASLSAVEINGTVRSATDKNATIVTDSNLMPAPGDKVEIFFKISGSDEEVSVATGRVIGVDGSSVKVEIVNASGEVGKDQLARITSTTAQPAATPTPSPSERDPNDVPNIFNEAQSVIEEQQRSPSPRPLATPSPRALSSPSATPKRLSGRWKVQNENASYTLTLRQEGKRVTGSYDLYNGTLKGAVLDDTLVATWQQAGNRRGGSARLHLSADGQTLQGAWAYDPSVYSSGLTGTGTWTFKRISR